jgi:RNA polymerase sigma-70 factor (ECF subfamily)
VLTYCARRTSRADAWDAASEVFLVAWRRFDDVPPKSEARAWLYGVAYKILANQRRAEQRRRRLFEKAAGVAAATGTLTDEPVIANPVDGEVIDALARLKAADREVLQMTLWEELSRNEIAEALGISTEAVHKRYSRAKKRLSNQLTEKSVMKGLATHVRTREEGESA